MITQVFIHKDEETAIAVCKDNHKGIVVQLVRYINTLKPGENNILENHRVPQVITQLTVTSYESDISKPNPKFKQELAEVITTMRKELKQVKALDAVIDGSLNDYYNQNKDLNTNE